MTENLKASSKRRRFPLTIHHQVISSDQILSTQNDVVAHHNLEIVSTKARLISLNNVIFFFTLEKKNHIYV